MSMSYDYCTARAREAATAAEEAKLDNVRERELRSEAAWTAMANRERSMQNTRENTQREKEAAAAAELAAG